MKLGQNNKLKSIGFISHPLTSGVIFILTVVGVVTFTKTVNASLISLVSSIFGGGPVSAEVSRSTSTVTSQTALILQDYAVNIDPNPDKQFDIVPIDNDDTLNPDLASSNSTNTDTSNMQINTYIVRQGDTISGIAKMFKVSINTVLWANNLTSKSSLKVGQTLVILPISGVSYTIKKGDTIKGIAQRCGADVNDILNYNNMSSMSVPIIAGQTLVIPDVDPDVELSPQCAVVKQTSTYATLRSVSGYFIRPVLVGRISQGLHGHNAVDFAAPVGTTIRASASGTVIIAKMDNGWNGGYGNYIVISHSNGTQTLYAHLLRGAVSNGQEVSQGQTIGFIGMTGKTTGPHLHYEIRGAKNPF